MSRKYEPEFKRKIVRLHLEEGRTTRALLQSMVSLKPPFLIGAKNSAKNASP